MFIVKTEEGYDYLETLKEAEELATILWHEGCETDITDSNGDVYELRVYLERRT